MKLTPEKKLERKLYSHLNKAIREYHLIEDDDKILIGLSGGKDSLALVKLLGQRSRVSRPSFKVIALHVRMKEISYESNTEYLETFCKENGVEFVCEETSIGYEFEEEKDESQKEKDRNLKEKDGSLMKSSENQNGKDRKTKTPCFLCSWNRRKTLFETAQRLGCNKIALGHHRDDIIHTTMLNLFFQGQFSTMPAMLKMKKMPVTIIRPMCLIDEADISEFSTNLEFKKQVKLCPHEHESNRTTMADLFKQIEEINPEARYCVMHALEAENKLIEI